MDLKEVLKNAATEPTYLLERKLNEFIIHDYRFRHFGEAHKKLVLDLIMKYKELIRKNGGISSHIIQEEEYHLYENRIKLNLTEFDLKEIKQILENFKK